MKQSSLLMTLPPEWVCTPDGMTVAENGNLVLACPNFADLTMKSCVLQISPDGKVQKWFDVPVNPVTGQARAMGVEFGPEGDLFLVDNPGWTGIDELQDTGRVLRLKVSKDGVVKCKVLAEGMEHPNGLRVRDGFVYVTQSSMSRQETESGKLMSCVYRFPADAEHIRCTNTLADPYILQTYITENPGCQYGVDGIAFDEQGRLYVGNFGDGAVYRTTLSPQGEVVEHVLWAKDPQQLQSTDGMTFDDQGNLYIADFSANAVAKVTPDGRVERIAQSPDCDGLNGELDQPGEPCIWQGRLILSCFDLVTGEDKVNTGHEMPATMAMIEL